MSEDEEPRRLALTKEDIEKIAKVLNTFLANTHANCVLLVDKDGYLLTKEGQLATYDVDTISVLVVSTFASVQQMANILGEQGLSVMVHQGAREYIQFFLVGDRTILAIIFDNKTPAIMVELYAGQVSAKLTELFKEIADRGRRPL